jgi:hypothetical protein
VRTLREIAALDGLAKNAETMREAEKGRAHAARQRRWEADTDLLATRIEFAQEQEAREKQRAAMRKRS